MQLQVKFTHTFSKDRLKVISSKIISLINYLLLRHLTTKNYKTTKMNVEMVWKWLFLSKRLDNSKLTKEKFGFIRNALGIDENPS